MKKHNMMRVASALAVVTLLSTSLISGTLAKYTSEKSADSSTVQVASWAFKVNDKNIATEDFTFDLFGTIKDSAGGPEEDVSKTKVDGKSIIAPGTTGDIELTLKNDSEVTASYTIEFKETQENAKVGSLTRIPLEYAIKEGDTIPAQEDWKTTIGDIDRKGTQEAPLTIAMNKSKTYKIYWRWNFGGDDTALGTATTAPTVKVNAKVTATQED